MMFQIKPRNTNAAKPQQHKEFHKTMDNKTIFSVSMFPQRSFYRFVVNSLVKTNMERNRHVDC